MTELRVIDGDGHRPWPQDCFGRALPRRPVRGLRIDVGLCDAMHVFERWRITTIARGVFVAHTGAREVRAPHAGWEAWLLELLDEGPVVVHLPGCATGWCHGCDGRSIRAIGPLPAGPLRLLPRPGSPHPPDDAQR